MATRTSTRAVAESAERCAPHGTPGTCWRCCEADMAAHLPTIGVDPGKYFDGANGEGTADKRPPAGNGTGSGRPVELATPNQVWKIRTERGQRNTTGVNVPADEDIPALSKMAASKLIDRLLSCPRLSVAAPRRYAPRASTPGQHRYVRDLLAERVHVGPVDVEALTFDEASTLIDTLIRAPRLVDASPLVDGMYRKDGVMYRVRTDKRGRKSCHGAEIVTDAERAPDGTITKKAEIKFYSATHMLATLTDADLMEADQVTAFGRTYGICVFGHGLTDPVSVYAGIGPKCASNVGIDQLAMAMANGYVPPVKATRKPRTVRATVVAPVAEAEPVADVYVSPWGSL